MRRCYCEKKAGQFYEKLTQHTFSGLDEFFHGLGYRPSAPKARRAFKRLLERNESIVATCMDAEYYTFATSAAAADRMFQDTIPLSEVRRRIAEDDAEYRDVTLLSGECLARLRDEAPPGADAAKHYASHISTKHQLSSTEFSAVKSQLFAAFWKEVEDLHRAAAETYTPAEAHVANACFQRCRSVLLRKVLRLSDRGVAAQGS